MRHPLQHVRHAYARRARDLPSVHAVFGEIDSVEQVSAFFKYCFMDEPRERRRRSLRPSARLHSSSSRGRVLYRVRCRMEASGKTLSKELSALKTKSLGGSLFQSRQDGQPAPQLLETDVVVLPPLTPAGLGPLYSCVMALEWSVGRAFHRMKVVLPQPSTRSMQHGACRYAKCNLGWPFRALADNASQTACRHYRRVGTIILSTVCAGDCCRCPVGRAASSCERTHAHA